MIVPFPITMAKPHEGPLPHAYVVRKYSQSCSHCGTLHEWNQLFTKTNLRSTLGHKFVTNFRALGREAPQFNLPIEVHVEPTVTIPFCHECPSPRDALRGLPPPPQPETTTVRTTLLNTDLVRNSPLHQDLEAKAKGPRAKREAKAAPTIDHLLKLAGLD